MNVKLSRAANRPTTTAILGSKVQGTGDASSCGSTDGSSGDIGEETERNIWARAVELDTNWAAIQSTTQNKKTKVLARLQQLQERRNCGRIQLLKKRVQEIKSNEMH